MARNTLKPRERNPAHRRVRKAQAGESVEARVLNALMQQGAYTADEVAELFHIGPQAVRQMRSGSLNVKQIHLDLLSLHLGNEMPRWLKRLGVDTKEALGFSEGL